MPILTPTGSDKKPIKQCSSWMPTWTYEAGPGAGGGLLKKEITKSIFSITYDQVSFLESLQNSLFLFLFSTFLYKKKCFFVYLGA